MSPRFPFHRPRMEHREPTHPSPFTSGSHARTLTPGPATDKSQAGRNVAQESGTGVSSGCGRPIAWQLSSPSVCPKAAQHASYTPPMLTRGHRPTPNSGQARSVLAPSPAPGRKNVLSAALRINGEWEGSSKKENHPPRSTEQVRDRLARI